MKIRIPFVYDADAASLVSGVDFDGATDLAVQSFAEETDINELVRRFGITGDLPVARELGEYGDFSEVVDFQTAMEQLKRGEEAFAELPARVRERFNNSPGEFWEWLQDDATENFDEAVALGLVERPPVIAPEGGGAARTTSGSSEGADDA